METNGLIDPKAYHANTTAKIKESVYWTDPRLAKITRFRLLSDPGYPFWDVSYIHGVLKDGSPVEVINPFYDLPKKGLFRYIVMFAKKQGVYAKGLGIFDAISTLN